MRIRREEIARPWMTWDTVEDVPEPILRTLAQAMLLPALEPEELGRMEAAFARAAVLALREMLWRERAAVLMGKLQKRHPELKRRAMYRAIALYVGKSEHTIRGLCCARLPGRGDDLVDCEEGEGDKPGTSGYS